MARIYTKTGDKGTTGLIGGVRVSKADPRIAAIGDVDETNAAIGIARSLSPPEDVDLVLQKIQSRLFDVGAALASTEGVLPASDAAELEGHIDRFEEELEPLRSFILPGGTPCAAQLHLARATCRRAERAVVELSNHANIPQEAVTYLNRLSDLLFVLARTVNCRAGVHDVKWTQGD